MNQASITTCAGLREAMWDVIHDEADPQRFTAKWLQQRLPYGARVRRILKQWTDAGTIERLGYGVYRTR